MTKTGLLAPSLEEIPTPLLEVESIPMATVCPDFAAIKVLKSTSTQLPVTVGGMLPIVPPSPGLVL